MIEDAERQGSINKDTVFSGTHKWQYRCWSSHGGVANEGENLLRRIRAYLEAHTYGMKNSPKVEIKQASLGYDAGKIGASALFI